MSENGYELGTAKTLEEVMAKRTNTFDELEVRELKTQWKHKISAIPEPEGITVKWWEFTNGVSRSGPSAEVPAGENIRNKVSGEYNVGDPALAGAGVRFGDALPVDGAGDNWFTGYSNRWNGSIADPDGVGIGVKYFQQGEGFGDGASEAGVQEYVFFDSAVTGVDDRIIPKENWNGDDVDLDFFRSGGFVRIDFTFYDEGQADVNWGVKTNTGIDIKTLHSFVVHDNPMWSQSDLKWYMETQGANVTGYIDAAHFKAGEADRTIRNNSEVRDGIISGSGVTVNQGDVRPLISVRLRNGWESINIEPISFTVEMDDSFYIVLAADTTLTGATFDEPYSDLPVSLPSSEYAVVTDVDATDFADSGNPEYVQYVEGAGTGTNAQATLSEELDNFAVASNENITLGIIPIDATTFVGSSIQWGSNF